MATEKMGAMGRSAIIPSHLTLLLKARNDVLGTTFSPTSFLSIDAVGSEIWTALHGYIDCDTHRRAPNNLSIKILNVRVLDYVVGRLFNDDGPPDRSHFSWSLPLALKLGEYFMSTSMVTLPRALSITRPASRARRWR